MSNRNQANPSSTPTSVHVGTRIKGVFETAHGIGENIRGRTLGAIDDLTHSGSSESKSHHASITDRGRLEAETGMAHISGYADPNVYRDELSRTSNSTSRTFGNGHTAGTEPGRGYVRAEEGDYYRDSRIDHEVGKDPGGYGMDDGYGQPGGVQNFDHQQPTIDRNTQMGPAIDQRGGLYPNRGPQNAGPEVGWTSMSQTGEFTPTQQRIKRDLPPQLPPRPQTQAADNDQRGQMY